MLELTYELIYAVRTANRWGKNTCETGLLTIGHQALLWVMAWHQTEDKPLFDPVFTQIWYTFMSWSLCNPFEDQAPVDLIYGCLIFKRVAVTYSKCQGTSTVAPEMVARQHVPFMFEACLTILLTHCGLMMPYIYLTHWGRATHICVSKLTIIGSDNGLSPDQRQAIIWTNAGLLLIGPLGTNFSEILIEILTFSFKKMRLEVSSAKRRPFCLGLNVLNLG